MHLECCGVEIVSNNRQCTHHLKISQEGEGELGGERRGGGGKRRGGGGERRGGGGKRRGGGGERRGGGGKGEGRGGKGVEVGT